MSNNVKPAKRLTEKELNDVIDFWREPTKLHPEGIGLGSWINMDSNFKFWLLRKMNCYKEEIGWKGEKLVDDRDKALEMETYLNKSAERFGYTFDVHHHSSITSYIFKCTDIRKVEKRRRLLDI